jgi:WhiB family transcriptional regulator, redox-sensing transcriptional regulator
MRQDELDHVASPWLAQLAAGAHWRAAAACGSADADLFFPVSASANNPQQAADATERAKAVCARCLVRRECLAFALRTRQLHGIWGGMTEKERYPRHTIAAMRTHPRLVPGKRRPHCFSFQFQPGSVSGQVSVR